MSTRYFQQTTVGGVPLTREISIRTASDAATLPDNPGPGRTLDKALAWGGERLERVITRVLSRTGQGPTSSIKDIVRAVYKSSMMPRACRSPCWCWQRECWVPCEYYGPPGEMTAPPTTYELPTVCEWLVCAANVQCCPKCGASMAEQDIHIPLKSSKKLVKLISATNNSSCYISLQLITLLATTFPSSRAVFAHMGASDVLHELSERMSDQLDIDPLLASSRRALVSLADAEILSLGKELKVMEDDNLYGKAFELVISKLIDCFSHTEKMLLALTVAHRNIWSLHPNSFPVLNTIYPMLLSRLASSSDPVEVAVLTDSLYRIISCSIRLVPWLIQIIKTRAELLEHIPYRLRSLIDGFPARYEQEAINLEHYFGRRMDLWRRAIWWYDPDDPEGEPDDRKFFKHAARDDGEDGYAKIDAVWWEMPVWEICDRRKRMLEERAEQGMEDRERRGQDGHRGRRPRAQSMTITAWPDWMNERQKDEAAEWREYWGKAAFVNFTGWPRKVGVWLEREQEPAWWDMFNGKREIFWTKLSTRMRSHSVD